MRSVRSTRCTNCYFSPVPARRAAMGYQTCLSCGEALARGRRFTVAPMHKSNYVLITDLDDLRGLNNKGGNVR